jgi:hypothetical protein
MSPQLEQIFNQAQQLLHQERLQLIQQLSSATNDDAPFWADKIAQMEQKALAGGQVVWMEGGLVVKGQIGEILDLDLVEFINQQREEGIQEVSGW